MDTEVVTTHKDIPDSASNAACAVPNDAPAAANADSVSKINASNPTAVDEGQAAKDAKGSFACKRFGTLQFKFKSAQMFSASTVVLKWNASGRSEAKVVGETGERTTKQALNAAVVKVILGPIVGPLMFGGKAKKGDNEIELTVWSEQLYKLNTCPGLTIDWSFSVKDGRKVNFTVQHVTDLVKSLQYREGLAKAWTEQQVLTKGKLQQSCEEERARIQQEVQEYQIGIDEATRKTEQLKCELKEQAQLAQRKLTKLKKDQAQTRQLNADKDELIAGLRVDVRTLEGQRLAYVEQVNDLSNCLDSLRDEKNLCIKDLWKERERIAKKDHELSGQKQTLRALNQQLEKYRTEFGEERQKLQDQITALEELVKRQEAIEQSDKRRFTDSCDHQQRIVAELRAALNMANSENVEQLSKIDQLHRQQQTLQNVVTKKDERITQVSGQYNTMRGKYGKVSTTLDAKTLEVLHLKKALQTSAEEKAEEKARVSGHHQKSIAALRLQLTESKEYAKKDLSDQTKAYKDLQCQLQKERSRCTNLGDANSALRQRVAARDADRARAEQISKRAQSTAMQLEEEVDQLRKLEAKAAAAARDASAKLMANKQDADMRLAEIKRQHGSELQRQRLVVEQQRSSIATLQKAMQKLENTRGGMAATHATGVDDAVAKMSIVFQVLKTKTANAIRKLTDSTEQQISTLRHQLADQQNLAQGLSMQLKSTRADLKSSNIVNKTLQMQNRSMVVQLADAKETEVNLIKQLKTCQTTERLLREQCSEFEFATNRKTRHLLSLRKIVDDLIGHLPPDKAKMIGASLLSSSEASPQVHAPSATVGQTTSATALTTTVPTTHPHFQYSAELQTLEQMGCGPPDMMVSMLVQFDGDVQKVVNQLYLR